jgi:hypothetical protein
MEATVTGREYLNRRKRWVMGLFYSGAVLFLGSLLVSGLLVQPDLWLYVGLPGFGAAFLGLTYGQTFGMRCPWCRGNLAQLALLPGPMSLDRRLHFCPYCGHRLDNELSECEVVESNSP